MPGDLGQITIGKLNTRQTEILVESVVEMLFKSVSYEVKHSSRNLLQGAVDLIIIRRLLKPSSELMGLLQQMKKMSINLPTYESYLELTKVEGEMKELGFEPSEIVESAQNTFRLVEGTKKRVGEIKAQILEQYSLDIDYKHGRFTIKRVRKAKGGK